MARSTFWLEDDPLETLRLADRWRAVAVRGVAAIVFGIFCLIAPFTSLLALVALFAIYACIDGASNLVVAYRARRAGRRFDWWGFEGLTSIAAGVIAFFWPGITTLVLLYVVASWALVTGVAEIVAAIRLRKRIEGEWTLAFVGVLSVAFGVFLGLFPGLGAIALVTMIGSYALLFGALVLALAFRLRRFRRGQERQLPPGGFLPTH